MRTKLVAMALAFLGSLLCGAAIGVQSSRVERVPLTKGR